MHCNPLWTIALLLIIFISIYRSSIVRNSLQKEVQLLQPLNLEVTVERNLAAIWYYDIPDIKIFGHLKPMNVSFRFELCFVQTVNLANQKWYLNIYF